MKKVFAGKIRTFCRTALVASCIAVFSISASRAENDPILDTLAADDATPYMEIIIHAASGDSRQKLVFGLHENASTGFDAGRDVLAPPPPPSNFDAKIHFDGEDYLVFYKPAEIKSHSILIEFHPEEGSDAVLLYWEPDSLSNGWDYQLMDTDGGDTFSLDMQDIDSLSSDAHDAIENGLLLVIRPELEVPELLAPADHLENIYPDSISLEWSGISQAAGYHLQLSHHADFDSLVMDTLVHEISYTFVGADYGTAYFWRVRAKGDDFADSPWSTIRSFTTIVEKPDPVLLSFPEQGLQDVDPLPRLSWEKSNRGDFYELQLSSDSEFKDPMIEDQISGETEYQVTVPLEKGSLYYWRVRSGNAGGLGDWSVVWSFTTVLPTNISVIELPEYFSLKQNYPNPFNSSTRISYTVPESGNVRIDVIDITGQRVATLVNEVKSPGWHNVAFDAVGLSSGVFIYRLKAGNTTLSKPMLLIK